MDKVFQSIVYGGLLFAGILVLYPLIFVISASISDPVSVNSGKVLLWPVGIQLDGYKLIFKSPWILVGYRNSLYYTVFGTFLNVTITFMAAYSLSRKDFFGRKSITIFMVFTMWFSGGLIPTFLVVRSLNLIDTPFVLIIMNAIIMFNTIICRTFIQNSIPKELQEAAHVDGCSDFGILFKIVMPLSAPILAVLALYYALGHWNNYFNALIYLSKREYQPLQIFIREVLVQNQQIDLDDMLDFETAFQRAQISQVMKYSLIVVASLPMLIIYPFVQKYFVKGVMIGAIKG
jgi:ABC-type glycerol-3-phosphate transport system permease component